MLLYLASGRKLYLYYMGIINIIVLYFNSVYILKLFQRNEVDNRTGLEYEGFQRSLNLVKSKGCKIATFVSDRHGSITKHMREKEEQTNHYFDLWHLKKSIYCIYILYYMTVIHNIWSKHSTLFFLHYTKFHNNLLANRYQYHTCDHFGMK